MKKILAFILAAIVVFALVSCGEEEVEDGSSIQDVADVSVYTDPTTGDKLTYEVDELGGYVITGFTSASSAAHKVVIPAEIENVEVTGIASRAFGSSSYLSEVEIPASVEYISDYAFYNCKYLTKVTMADSVTKIGVGVFEHCKVLASVNLSANIDVVPAYIFNDCPALTSIVIPEKVTEIGECAFMGCASFTEVTVPANVKTIGDCAFYNNTLLTKAIVPANVETFGQFVFNAAAEGFVLVGAEGSAAATYAVENEHTFEVLA